MIQFSILSLLSLLLYVSLKKTMQVFRFRQELLYNGFKEERARLEGQFKRIKEGNAALITSVEETIELYDITKQICLTLDEEKVFSIFRERINKYVRLEDCKFLHNEEDIGEYQMGIVFPLLIHRQRVGYLVAKGLAVEDHEKFHILAHQFLLGIKRALLYKKVQGLTITDGLTKVFSRRYFLDRLREETERSRKLGNKYSFLIIDIDRFKDYNDHYGHLVGDVILKEVTKLIKDSIRQVDFMGRYGGEELTVVLVETDKPQALMVAERICQAIAAKQIHAYDEVLSVTISVGLATFPNDSADYPTLIDLADQALYRAKEQGRNKVCSF